MNLRRHCVLGLFSLCAGLCIAPGHAAEPLRQAGALVWEMGDVYWDFDNQRRARRITSEQVAALADKAAGKLARHRDDLAGLLHGLDPQSRFAQDLRRMVEQWSDRDAFREALMPGAGSDKLGLALGGLKGQVSDPRRAWTTPFPLFRP